MSKISMLQAIFWLEFYLYTIIHTIDTTAFSVYLPNFFLTYVRYSIIIFTILFLLFIKKIECRLIPLLLCIVAGIANYIVTGFAIPLELFCIAFYSSQFDFKKVLKHYFYIVCVIMGIAMIASFMGIIATNDVVQMGVVRHAFGATYATDFAAHVFYLVLVDNYLHFSNISVKRCVWYLFAALFIWIFCNAMLDTILIIILTTLDIFLMLSTKVERIDITEFRGSKLLRWCISGIFIFMTILSFYGAYHYNDNAFMQELNKAMSYRMSFSMQGIDMYGYPLFGKLFSMVGSATISRSKGLGLQYFFVDNSYVYIMLRYGVATLITFVFAFTLFINKRIEKKDTILPLFLGLIAISSFVDHHLFSIYNPFIFALGAVVPDWAPRKKAEKQ